MALDGAWTVKLLTPIGEREALVVLATNGALLTGTFTGPMGSQELHGTIEGKTFVCSAEVRAATGTLALSWEGVLNDDDVIAGTMRGPMGPIAFSGVRRAGEG